MRTPLALPMAAPRGGGEPNAAATAFYTPAPRYHKVTLAPGVDAEAGADLRRWLLRWCEPGSEEHRRLMDPHLSVVRPSPLIPPAAVLATGVALLFESPAVAVVLFPQRVGST